MILHRLVKASLERPKTVLLIYAVITVLFLVQFPKIRIDTDPENMLYSDEPARVAHREFKDEFALHDAIIVGVVDSTVTEGVFTPQTLNNIRKITEDIAQIEGVIAYDILSLSTTDDIEGRAGALIIEPLLKGEIKDPARALAIRDKALGNPILKDMLVSADGKAVAIAVPIKEKDQSYRISVEIEEIIQRHKGGGK